MSTTPNVEHPEYTLHKAQVKTVYDIYNGVDSAKAYLRKFEREETDEYKNRQSDATLDNYTLRTTQTNKNIIFRKPINTEAITNQTVLDYLKEIDLSQDINEFSKEVLINRVRDGKTYILVDAPSVNEEIQNKAQADEMGIRPYFVNILRKNLFNWKMDDKGNYEWICFYESYEEVNGFDVEVKTQTKVYFNDGRVQIWREDKLFQEFNRGVNQITLVQIGEDDIPPLYDLTKINIAQFNRNSERQNYVRVGGAPFPIIKGSLLGGDDDGVKTIAINQGLHFADSEGGFEWGEMTGQNDTMLKGNIEDLNAQMLNIAISFSTKTDGNKTATQVNEESTEDKSKLTDYATELEAGLNQAIELMPLFKTSITLKEDEKVVVNKDFDSNTLTEAQVASYLSLYTQNIISWERFLDILAEGEVLPVLDDKAKETEKARIRDQEAV